jgi:hypothetical protein
MANSDSDSMPEVPAAASDLVAACEEAWRSIQVQHPDVPDVVLVLGTGVERGRLVKLGHWWGGRWMADGQVRGEVLLAGEALHLQPAQVFEVLLHEAAHGLNAARGIKDASRGGRYHNARFKAAAEELGLVVRQMPPYGWAETALGPSASEAYEADIARIGDAMRIARRLSADVRIGETGADQGTPQAEGEGPTTGDGSAKPGPAACACGRKMRMAPSVLAQGPVVCGLCGQEFSTERRADRPNEPDLAGSAGTPTVDHRFLDRRRAALEAERPSGPAHGHGKSSLDAIRRSGLDHLTALAAKAGGVALIAELGAWKEAQRHGDPRPILATTDEELRAANDAARALLKIEGALSGDPMVVAGREVLIGDLLIIGEHDGPLFDLDGSEFPPPGVLGTVVEIDRADGVLEVDFAIAGRHRLDATSPAADALDYAYAERVAFVGAPLLDLRTLPELDRAHAVELVAVPELSW